MENKSFFVLTGDPGVGKTTIIKKLVSQLANCGVKTSGFYTEEVRKSGTREGFDVVSLQGDRGCLARDLNLLNGPIKHKVGKYGVLVQEFEKIALPTLEKHMKETNEPHVFVIDEIGKMEFFSEPFKLRVKQIFSEPSNNFVLATIPVRKSDYIIENLRNNVKSKVWMVTRTNRNNIDQEIIIDMRKALKV